MGRKSLFLIAANRVECTRKEFNLPIPQFLSSLYGEILKLRFEFEDEQ
jgi:hypothetical protein